MSVSIPFSSSDNPKSVEFSPGFYNIQLWGAEGGSWDSANYGGRGAYTSGFLTIRRKTTFHFYIGEKGTTITGKVGEAPATFNGGGSGYLVASAGILSHYGSSGGGATDMRTVKGLDWNDEESLKSRIMVAAGGGGATKNSVTGEACKGGYGGSYEGGNGVPTSSNSNIEDAIGGYQNNTGSAGGKGKHCSGENGSFGVGGNGGNCYSTSGGGGGSGVSSGNHQCGAGGSSYVSGLHNSGIKKFVFLKAQMIPGNNGMLEPTGETSIGHSGNGYAEITKISSIFCTKEKKTLSFKSITCFIMIILS